MLYETPTPPLEIDDESRWYNPATRQTYMPRLNGAAWHSPEGSIYPFPKGTKFTEEVLPGLKLTSSFDI